MDSFGDAEAKKLLETQGRTDEPLERWARNTRVGPTTAAMAIARPRALITMGCEHQPLDRENAARHALSRSRPQETTGRDGVNLRPALSAAGKSNRP
jgi:hypothetical protein